MALTINHQTNDISATSGSMTIDGAAVGGGGGGASSINDLSDAVFDSDNNLGLGSLALSSITAGSGIMNTAVGQFAGRNVTTGDQSVYLGRAAGSSITTGYSNVAIGYSSLGGQSGHTTIAIGHSALGSGSYTGSHNVGIGYGILSAATSAVNNVAIGTDALDDVTTGARNTAVGYSAGTRITTGGQNVMLGAMAMEYSNSSAGNNTAVGTSAMRNLSTGTYNIGIGSSTASGGAISGNNNVLLGYQAAHNLTSGIHNIMLGNTAGFDMGSGAYNVLLGVNAGGDITTGTNNVAIGKNALDAVTNGGGMVAIGMNAGGSYSGTNNFVAVGESCFSGTGGMAESVGVGYGCGAQMSSGQSNVLVGFAVGTANTGGSSNTYVGKRVSGNANAVGTGSNNVGVGENALYNSTSGNQNTAVGKDAGNSLTTGANNTIIGYDADASSATVSNEITIGNASATGFRMPGLQASASNGQVMTYNSSTGLIALANSGYIVGGTNISTMHSTSDTTQTGGTGTMKIGFEAGKQITSSGDTHNTYFGYQAGYRMGGDDNVGIGSGTMFGSVSGYSGNTGSRNIAVGKNLGQNITTAAQNIMLGSDAGMVRQASNVIIGFGHGSNTALSAQNGNNILLGYGCNPTATSAYKQIVIGNSITSKGNSTTFIGGVGGVYNEANSSTWSTTSDERIKTNITGYTTGLAILDQINVKTYNYLSDEAIAAAHPELADENGLVHEGLNTEKTIVGIVAQELETLLPDSVTTRDNGIKVVNNDELFWVMLNSIKELKTANDLLAARVEALENIGD